MNGLITINKQIFTEIDTDPQKIQSKNTASSANTQRVLKVLSHKVNKFLIFKPTVRATRGSEATSLFITVPVGTFHINKRLEPVFGPSVSDPVCSTAKPRTVESFSASSPPASTDQTETSTELVAGSPCSSGVTESHTQLAPPLRLLPLFNNFDILTENKS